MMRVIQRGDSLNFIYVYKEETKNKLIENGFIFMREVVYGNRQAFLFANNGSKLTFNQDEAVYSNKLIF